MNSEVSSWPEDQWWANQAEQTGLGATVLTHLLLESQLKGSQEPGKGRVFTVPTEETMDAVRVWSCGNIAWMCVCGRVVVVRKVV